MTSPAAFLEKLRPGGPWVLTAIIPDGSTYTITAHNADEVNEFVGKYDGERNLYYTVNPTRSAVRKKPSKLDIAAVEYLLADLDPNHDEASEAAKERYLSQLMGTFEPKPTVVIDSGNGIQCLWRLAEPIALPPAGAETVIADVEGRSKALMLRLGSEAGTQNIDRVLRLPGTTNLPNKKKREAGRVPCPTKLLDFNGVNYSLDVFPPPVNSEPGSPEDGGQHARHQEREPVDIDALPISDRMKDLIRGIHDSDHPYKSKSEPVLAVLIAMAAAGCTDDQMAAVMLDKSLPIGEHVRGQQNIGRCLARTIKKARAKVDNKTRAEPKIKVRLEDVLKSATDLQTKTFDPLRWIVPRYLPEGLTVLGGKPKVGKSWMGLDIADGVAAGGECLGQTCEQGDVLALMLEDSDRRLQRRLTTMLGASKQKWPNITYATQWPRLTDGGLDWIREWIDSVRKARLIIIDILERIRQRTKHNDKQTQYSADYDALATLQELATEAQLSILVMHHQRKLGAEDLIETLSGTLGLGGAVDAVLILGKHAQFGKYLYGRGRDLEEFNISIKQNEQSRWQVLGPMSEEQASPERAQIIAVLARAGKPMTTKEISEAVGGKYPNIKQLLSKLHFDGQVERITTGLYKLPEPQQGLNLGEPPF